MSGSRCTDSVMLESLDGPLMGGLLQQTGLEGYVEGRFEVTIHNPTSDTTRKQRRRTVLCEQQCLYVGITFPEGSALLRDNDMPYNYKYIHIKILTRKQFLCQLLNRLIL